MKFSKIVAAATACILTVTGICSSGIWTGSADTEELMHDTFEGDYGSWKGVGASTTLSSDQAYDGDQSLYVYDRTATWGAPRCSLSTIVAEGYTYEISGYTYYEGDGSQSVGLKMLYTDSDGEEQYDSITYVTVTAGTWTCLSGSYTVPEDATGVTLYIEYSNADTDQNFYIDEVIVSGEAVEIELTDSFYCDFEDGTTQDWVGRGSASVELSEEYAYSESHSLFVSGRTELWNGTSIAKSDMIEAGGYYEVGCYVLYDGDEWEDTQSFSINLQYDLDGEECYYTIATATANKGEWTYVGSEFTAPDGAVNFYIYVQTAYTSSPEDQDLMDFYMDDAFGEHLPDPEIQYDIDSLKDVYADYFKLGCAVTASELSQDATKELIIKHYNSITLGNELKPDSVMDEDATLEVYEETGDDTQIQISLDDASDILEFAAENDIPVRGHVLVWHQQTPLWFFKEGYDENGDWVDEDTMTARLENYIQAVMETLAEEYPDVEFYAWDVVNEAASDSGTIREGGDDTDNGESPWVAVYGDQEYIELAFQFAREYAPEDCKLFYNDYNEYTTAKQAYIISDILEPLIEEGLIDGMGMQSHIGMSSPSIEQYQSAMQAYADLGLEVQVTELDISQLSNSEADQLELAERYQEVFKMYKEMVDSGVDLSAVVLWGITDSTSWIGGYPLLFDKDYQAKAAFYAVIDTDSVVETIATMTAYAYDGSSDDLELALEIMNAQDVSDSDASFKLAWDEDGLVARIYGSDALESGGTISIYGSDESETGSLLTELSFDTLGDSETLDIDVPITGEAGDTIYLDVIITTDDASYAWNDDDFAAGDSTDDGPTCGYVTLEEQPAYAEAVKTEETITIDGEIEDAWENANTIDVDNYSLGSGATGVSRMLWDENYIYILTEVTDSYLTNASANAYEQDTVEVFFDENNNKSSSYESDDIQVRVSYTGDKTVTDGLSTDAFESAASITDTGYIVEIAIPYTITNFTADQIVGFDVQVNDDADGDGSRDSIANWNDLSGMGYTDPSGFGVLKLVEDDEDASTEDSSSEDTEITTDTEATLVGDVNLDGNVTLADSVLLAKYFAKTVSFDDQQIANGDVYQDEQLNSNDASTLLQYQVCLITELPVIP